MKTLDSHEDKKLKSLLDEARPVPDLPPRFQENVWRRIESAEAGKISGAANWLDALAGWLMRPRLAFALAAVLLFAGSSVGWIKGQQLGRHEAQARYVEAVAPGILR